MRRLALALAALSCFAFTPAPARAGTVEKTVPFAIDQWVALDSTDGPVSLHRLKLVNQKGGFTKSAFLRPGNDEYLATVQIQIEYSNSSKDDRKARVNVVWLDGEGAVIDGYNDDESLDDDENHKVDTITLSTLKYGLGQAKQLRIKINYDR